LKELLSKALQMAVIALGVAIIAGCQGPQGPAGEDGVDGIDANANCIQCHANDQEIVAKVLQWETSNHNVGTGSWGRGSSSSCAMCHNGAAYVDYVTTGAVTAKSKVDKTNANCRTCHTIHTAFDSTDWALTNTTGFTLMADPGGTIDYGNGNLCAVCHQSRRNPSLDSSGLAYVDDSTVAITSSHYGAHHGPQANLVNGEGGWEGLGTATKASSMHNSLVTNGCVDCHLHTDMVHDFQPVLASCNISGCHTPALTDMDHNNVQTDVQNLLDELEDSLLVLGALEAETHYEFSGELDTLGSPIFEAEVSIHNVRDTFSVDIAGATQNYIMCTEDGSNGVHNAKYIKYLLNSALEAVKN
jgi:hypothetical protein